MLSIDIPRIPVSYVIPGANPAYFFGFAPSWSAPSNMRNKYELFFVSYPGCHHTLKDGFTADKRFTFAEIKELYDEYYQLHQSYATQYHFDYYLREKVDTVNLRL